MNSGKITFPAADLFPLAEEYLAQGKDVVFTVTGISMWPLIRHRHDSVRLSALRRLPRRGDIVLYKTPSPKNKYILHRVYKVTGDTIVTLGDNRLEPDPAVPARCVIGRAEAVLRGKREYNCDGPLLRSYAWIWLLALPVRRPLLRLLLLAGKLLRKLGLR